MKLLLILIIPLMLCGVFSHILFRKFKWYRKHACKIGWHSYPNFNHIGFDGASEHASCKWCGYSGMIDSQGNLF